MTNRALALLTCVLCANASVWPAAASAAPAPSQPTCRADFADVAAALPDGKERQALSRSPEQIVAQEGGLDQALANHRKALADTDKIWAIIQKGDDARAVAVFGANRRAEQAVIDALQCRKTQGAAGR
ncbi:MAG: hypothetical protein JWM33_1276 [Caulobacteraceae bacterium]|nr:hypothetical protein [Caulobacteraceae bacterium]